MNKYLFFPLVCLIFNLNCSQDKLPPKDFKLSASDLKKDEVDFKSFSIRIPPNLKCEKDTTPYPDFDIYRFKNNDSIVLNLYVGNQPDLSDSNLASKDTSIGPLHLKLYTNVEDTNDNNNILITTGFTFPGYAHFWFNKENKEKSFEIIRTMRRK
jgi:hypothetical protein